MKIPAIIVDIDDTFVDSAHKADSVKKSDWKMFAELSEEDQVNRWCSDIVESMAHKFSYHILFVTSRNSDMHDQTYKFIMENLDNEVKWNLYMRNLGDLRHASVVKLEIYKTIIEPTFDVMFVLDDNKEVIEMFREIGVTALQCGEGLYNG